MMTSVVLGCFLTRVSKCCSLRSAARTRRSPKLRFGLKPSLARAHAAIVSREGLRNAHASLVRMRASFQRCTSCQQAANFSVSVQVAASVPFMQGAFSCDAGSLARTLTAGSGLVRRVHSSKLCRGRT